MQASSRTLLFSVLASVALAALALPAKAATEPAKKTAASKPDTHPAAKTPQKAAIKVPLPRPNPRRTIAIASATGGVPAVLPGQRPVPTPVVALARPAVPTAVAPTITTSPADRAAIAGVIEQARKGRPTDATEIAKTIADPLARKLAEWVILRSEDGDAGFERYAAFVAANPGWPSTGMLRRRAEGALWEERRDAATVRNYFADQKPISAKGNFALARALLAQGDRRTAELHVREAWRNEPLSRELETAAYDQFQDLLTQTDHKARMDVRFYAEDVDAAMRMAQRLGGNDLAIAKARAAVIRKAGNAKALLDAVPADARRDAGYIFSHVQWLRRNDKNEEAGQLILTAPRDAAQIHNTDQWWIERRLLARKLLDIGDPKTAYRVASEAAAPARDNYRVEQQFTAGWIALRFLNDPATALTHFALANRVAFDPISLARAGYWQGRASEALGRREQARAHYEAAARYSTAYYGQLARARLGLPEIALQAPPEPAADRRATLARAEVVRAAEILYALGERNLIIPFVLDAAEKASDAGVIVMLAELAKQYDDARAMLLIGKAGLARGFALDHYAFPASGVPNFNPIGPNVEPSVVYSIIRQESQFNPKVVSTAKAMGLMQVTPAAGRDMAKKYGASYDQNRLLNDNVYNLQMGAAELGGNIEDYRGSYILAFAAYNAGRGSVKGWIDRYGDPRDGKVDPVDWVERIPFAETRNYVQRVMENVQVYRARFGGGSRLMIEADIRRGARAD